MPQKKKKSNRISRSSRLRKYESVYERCLKKTQLSDGKNTVSTTDKEKKERSSPIKKTRKPKYKSPFKTRSSCIKKDTKKKKTKRVLTSYQKFVRSESKKIKYKGIAPKERMQVIGKAWKNKK